MIGLVLFSGNPNPIPILIAIFIGFAGLAEARQVEVTESIRGLSVRQVMVRSQNAVPMDLPLYEIARRWQSTRESALPVLSTLGTFVGMIRLEDISKALDQQRDPATTAGELVDHESGDSSVQIDEDLQSVILRVGHRGRQLAVTDHDGRLLGILDLNSMLLRGKVARQLPNVISSDDRFDAVS